MSEEDYKKYQEEHFLSLETNAKRRERDVKQKITEWSNEKFPPYNLDGENMINSWLYEISNDNKRYVHVSEEEFMQYKKEGKFFEATVYGTHKFAIFSFHERRRTIL